MNESRPGVSSGVLKPQQAISYLKTVLAERPEITVMGIAGPGDPFANPEETMETLRLARREFPDLMLCLASNGLGIGPYIPELAELKVSHVTITVNAVDPEIGARIYAWVRDGKRPLREEAAARLLIERQLTAIRELKAHDIVVKINSIILPDINDHHIPKIAQVVSEMGVDFMNCIPMMPVKGAAFEDMAAPDATTVARVRLTSGQYLPQMVHCSRCRADAVGLLDEVMNRSQMETLNRFARSLHIDWALRPCVAVVSTDGIQINQHLGEASRVLIFRKEEEMTSGFRFSEMRLMPSPGSGGTRWGEVARILYDCGALLVNAAGPTPRQALQENGIAVVEVENSIAEGLEALSGEYPMAPVQGERPFRCQVGKGCQGTASNCA